jgi:spore maturation protein CgeB
MKILLVGSNFSYAIERYFVRYLTEMGVNIHHFNAPDIVFNYHSKNIINKILFHSGLYTGYRPVNKQLLEIAADYRPDIIWVFKGMEIYPDTLAKLRNDYKLANYNPDHPFIITSRGSGNKNVTDSVHLYHTHFCYHNELMERIRHEFGIHTVFLPFSYDEADIQYTPQSTIKEINRICFQANPDAYRVSKIELLTEAGLEVDVYGIGWSKTRLADNKRIKLFNIASRSEFWKLNQQYRVQLNLFRQYNVGSHNMRTFEIPAVGGIQLTPYSEEQAMFFEENSEIFFFRDDAEMIETCEKIMNFSDTRVEELRKAARNRSLTAGYTFKDRSRTVFNTFKEMMTW